LYPDPLTKVLFFLLFLFLAIIGAKLICGWVCPFGALQELLYSIPVFNKIKKRKVPFLLSNTIRGILFIAALLILFGIIGDKKGLVIYHYVNPFNLFNIDFDSISILITVITVITLSIFTYRPFCQFICPFGFISWVFERLSIFSIKIDFDTCTKCGLCDKACPTKAIEAKVNRKNIQQDCFSCARCLNICPSDSIKYKLVFNTNKNRHNNKNEI
ncbi:MAG: 4Fe-4S binding protein, partial [Calditrichia bacterium]|nr:4Fe-4S binding protein [Calditrichia bacterium]